MVNLVIDIKTLALLVESDSVQVEVSHFKIECGHLAFLMCVVKFRSLLKS